MFKRGVLLLSLIPMFANANNNFGTKELIGKWQCHSKLNGEMDLTKTWYIEYLTNGMMNETIKRHQGQKKDYDHQIETTKAKANWSLVDNTLIYNNYQIDFYSLRMPNSDKYDIVQADIALQHSLPIVEQMVGNIAKQKTLDSDFVHKKSLVLHDRDSQQFLYCQKRSWIGNFLTRQ